MISPPKVNISTMTEPLALKLLAEKARAEEVLWSYPAEDWVEPHSRSGVVDVLIVGAGQFGLSTAVKLKREGIRNIVVLDAAPDGHEGPWGTWARMETLRTRKDLHGVENGNYHASFPIWFDAAHGEGAYDALNLIPKEDWLAYLGWLREVFGITVRNQTTVTELIPDGSLWAAETRNDADQSSTTVYARHVVLATGFLGAGGAAVPEILNDLPRESWAHSSDDVDWSQHSGDTVAVLGIGASAFDNSATALEQGAEKVWQFGRRQALPTFNPYRFLEKRGLLTTFSALDDEARLDIARTGFALPMPAPEHSVQRCQDYGSFELELGAEITSISLTDERRLELRTSENAYIVDFVIAATGFQVDLSCTPWLAQVHSHIETWGDRFELGVSGVDKKIAPYPYLDSGLAAQPRSADAPEALGRLHFLGPEAHVSNGIAASGINGLPWASDAVVRSVVADLVGTHSAALAREFRTLAEEN